MKITLTITFDAATGEFQFTNESDNHILAYGMLEQAKLILARRQMDPDAKKLVQPIAAMAGLRAV